MSVSQHRHKDPQKTENQKNLMSEDPRDGARRSDTLGKEGKEPMNVSPERERQRSQEKLEEFGAEGATGADKD